MAFTSRLGTSDSALGHVQLGAGGVLAGNYDNSVSVDGASAIAFNQLFFLAFSIDCTAATTLAPGFLYANSITIDGDSAASCEPGFRYLDTLSIDGVSAAGVFIDQVLVLTIAGNTAVTIAGNFVARPALSAAGMSAVTVAHAYTANPSKTIGGFSAIAGLPGQPYTVTCAIEGLSSADPLPGTGFFDTLSVNGDSSVTIDSESIKLLEFSIDGVSAVDEETIQNGRIFLTVGGFSAATISPSFAYVLSVSAASLATMYVQDLYNFLDVVAVDAFDSSSLRTSSGLENPASQGSVSATCTGVFNRAVAQTLVFAQLGAIKKPTEIIDTFHIVSQTVAVVKVHNKTVAQTLSLTQEAEARRAIVQTLTIAQEVVGQHVRFRTVGQTLGLAQAAARQTVLVRSLDQTLVMGQSRRIKTPLIGTIGSSGPTIFEYVQPVARPILVPVRCLTVLGVPSQTIVLPCPQFGDTQLRSSEVNLKRTMTGDTYTYVRRVELQKLKYVFWMGTKKAIEFQIFLEAHCHELMTLLNYRGETWYGNVTNNPFEFTADERWQNRGEKHEVTIEFEGVQQ